MSALADFKNVQRILGVLDDGENGTKTRAAFEALGNRALTEIHVGPEPAPNGPWPREADAASFYGHSDGSAHWEAENLIGMATPYPMNMDGAPINTIRCHKRMRQYRAALATPKRPTVPSLERDGLLGCAIIACAVCALAGAVAWIVVGR